MRAKALAKIAASALRRPLQTASLLTTEPSAQPSLVEAVRRAADWLLMAQERSIDGDGYARMFSLIRGWDRGYIETTGYIITTLLDAGALLGDGKYRESALRAGEWLLTVQSEDGSFPEIDSGSAQAFDTGQVMLGLNRLAVELADERYLASTVRAAQWLLDNQEEDGCWRRVAYNERPHAYYTRVAAAMLHAGQLAGSDTLVAGAIKNLEWSLSQRGENGYYRYSEFKPGEDALLHTLVYILEGFVMAHELTGEARWADAAVEGVRTLGRLVDKDGLLRSQYSPEWKATNPEICVTGLAQYAGACFDAARLSGDASLIEAGVKPLKYLAARQILKGEDMIGAVPSSLPVWGYYGGMELFNWNMKFFIDAVLKSGLAVGATGANPVR
ncbi:MAG: prenyltransferase/squalene oxidase repeat-containing protein [Caulobacteraceae bacterium]